MKVLYAIQGTGNGHVSRASEIIPILRRFCDCDALISSSDNEVQTDFVVKYKIKGLGFAFGKQGGIDIPGTIIKTDLVHLWREIRTIPVEAYDLVINDFEPVTAWACRLSKVPCIGLSHQGSLLSGKVPQPIDRGWIGPWIIRHYAPAEITFGFHFAAYDDFIFTPVIRSAARNQHTEDEGHITVYLPAWDDNYLISFLERFEGIGWHLFSKRAQGPFRQGNISVSPVSVNAFTRSMASSSGVLCGAGFETPAEALFMKKKLMVVPMKGQYEQHCNAQALAEMGVTVIYDLDDRNSVKIHEWLRSGTTVQVDFPDQTEAIIRHVLEYADKSLLGPRLAAAYG